MFLMGIPILSPSSLPRSFPFSFGKRDCFLLQGLILSLRSFCTQFCGYWEALLDGVAFELGVDVCVGV